jgi:hypothetical protein
VVKASLPVSVVGTKGEKMKTTKSKKSSGKGVKVVRYTLVGKTTNGIKLFRGKEVPLKTARVRG